MHSCKKKPISFVAKNLDLRISTGNTKLAGELLKAEAVHFLGKGPNTRGDYRCTLGQTVGMIAASAPRVYESWYSRLRYYRIEHDINILHTNRKVQFHCFLNQSSDR
jgi:hypothetical protein